MSTTAWSSFERGGKPIVCYGHNMVTTIGAWQGENPLDFSLPLLLFDLTFMVIFTRFFIIVLKPLGQPRVVAEILAGIVVGPSLLGKLELFNMHIFPLRSVIILETMSDIGLVYTVFLIGVETDLTMIRQTGRKAVSIALGGMIFPLAIGFALSNIIPLGVDATSRQISYFLFLGVTLAATTFPVLARLLAERKLINSEIGQIAMSSGILNDLFSWVLLALAVALTGTAKTTSVTSLSVILSSIVFVLICIFVFGPIINWLIRRTPEGEPFSDFNMTIVLAGVVVCGCITDFTGTHYAFGAFVYGLIIPSESLGMAIVERLEDLVSGLLLPIFYVLNGLKTDVSVVGYASWVFILGGSLLAYIGKVVGITAVSHYYYNIPVHEGVALGFLLNTKGILEITVLNIARDNQVLENWTFSVMVVAVVLMSGLVGPLVSALYRSTRGLVGYKRRTLKSNKFDSELRILSCIHNQRNVPTLVSLIEATSSTKRSPLCVYVLHLIELTGRASAMLIVHNTTKTSSCSDHNQSQTEHIFSAFENYGEQGATIQPLTAISPYSSMHEDICSFAEDKRVSFIILPFHKQQTVDGSMESTIPAFRTINQNVLANAPCSVGILVDRGLGSGSSAHHVAVLFFGGHDDREALSYAWGMCDHPGIFLTVIRFRPGIDAISKAHTAESSTTMGKEFPPDKVPVAAAVEKERRLDEEYLDEFRTKTGAANVNNESILYVEKVVNSGQETVAAIRGMDNTHDLYIVGRGQGMISPLIEGLNDWSECPELGAIGDMLASSDFLFSVLVVQQYASTPHVSAGIGLTAQNSRQTSSGASK